uniref:Putative secreted peptide n=1 Tax=Anopheles braziliensis TaxID=58242 RepID=A0A2M3ZVL8_9DIPT
MCIIPKSEGRMCRSFSLILENLLLLSLASLLLLPLALGSPYTVPTRGTPPLSPMSPPARAVLSVGNPLASSLRHSDRPPPATTVLRITGLFTIAGDLSSSSFLCFFCFSLVVESSDD